MLLESSGMQRKSTVSGCDPTACTASIYICGNRSCEGRLVRLVGVVPADPLRDDSAGLRRVLEQVLPDVFLLEAMESIGTPESLTWPPAR